MDEQSTGGGCPQSPTPSLKPHHNLTHNKKLRRKRKELDALVADDKIKRRKSLKSLKNSRHDLLQNSELLSDSDEVEFRGHGRRVSEVGVFGGLFGGHVGRGGPLTMSGCLPGLCCMLILLATAAVAVATMKLLMVTRRDLDELQTRLNAVEAGGSELPAKFHESHVRLQQLELNHTSLWEVVSSLREAGKEVDKKLSTLQSSLKELQSTFSSSPEISSLPKDVATLQESVATFGSSLKDVQSSLKMMKESEAVMEDKINKDGEALLLIKNYVASLENLTNSLQTGREGTKMSLPESLMSVRNDMVKVTTEVSVIQRSIASINDTIHTQTENNIMNIEKSVNNSVSNLSSRVQELESASTSAADSNSLTSQISNLTRDVSTIKNDVERQRRQIEELTQSVAVVKGVEKKLEGSQLQMASGVSELKQQIVKVANQLKSLTPTTTTIPPRIDSSKPTSRRRKRSSAFS